MPVTRHNPKTVPLAGKYTHGIELPPGQRILYVSGQVGTDAKGKVATGIEKQCDAVLPGPDGAAHGGVHRLARSPNWLRQPNQ
jgi:enamine deaminase RidA (YjgF/YER057c/UK114 family)